MDDVFPPGQSLSVFLAAAFVLAVTPGPGVLYIVTRSLLQGRRFGLASVAGVAIGNLGNALGASLGLAALFSISTVAFSIVKYAGALYLIYLGVKTLRAAPAAATASPSLKIERMSRVFRDGLIVALFNPKTAIFFAAFLPQFMNTNSRSALQSALLGTMFVAIAAATDSLYAVSAGMIAPRLVAAKNTRSLGKYLTGSAFIGIGLLTAFAGQRSANR
jgi:threonine/homoserine/homoserine lactone efflux protein